MIHHGKSRLHHDKPLHSWFIFSDGAPHTVSLVNPIQSAQEVGPKFTTQARFGFQILLNYTGGALIFIRREQLCWKLKQISRTHCPLHVRHVSFAPGMPARSESVTGCHGHFLIRQDLSKQMCLCLGGFSRSVMRNPKVDPD